MIFTDFNFNVDPKLIFGCGITEFKKGMPNIRGIYAIVCLANERIYFGSSKDVRKRIKAHLRALLISTHFNSHLLKSYNKYGKENFACYLMEEVPDNVSLLDVEQNYLDNYQGNLFNINKTTTGKPMTSAKKEQMAKRRRGEDNPYRLKNKYGEIFEFFSANEFAEKHNFDVSGITGVLAGKRNSYHDLYLPETPIREFYLMNKAGEVHSFKYTEEFARENNVDGSSVRKVLCGELQSVEGWTLPGNPKIEKEYNLVSPDGVVHTTDNIKKFARENNLAAPNLSSLLSGRYQSVKGWTALGRPKQKIEHKLIDPQGDLHTFNHILNFSKMHGLNNCCVGELLNGKRIKYKGWTAVK